MFEYNVFQDISFKIVTFTSLWKCF